MKSLVDVDVYVDAATRVRSERGLRGKGAGDIIGETVQTWALNNHEFPFTEFDNNGVVDILIGLFVRPTTRHRG